MAFTALALALIPIGQPDGSERSVVQARKFSLGHELSLSIGSMPLDPFEKGWSAGLSYTMHFGGTFSWELLNAAAALLVPTALRNNLVDRFGRRPDEFSAPRAMVTTGFVVAPLYGKMALLDGLVIHQALFLGVHAGAMFGNRPTVLGMLEDVRPSAGLGVGYRMFFNEWFSMRLDVRDFLSFRRKLGDEPQRFEQVLTISVALAFSSKGDE